MSNTVKTFDVTFDGEQTLDDLYLEVSELHPPEDSPSLVLRTMTHGPQHWGFGMMDYVLEFNWDTKLFSLFVNNLVA